MNDVKNPQSLEDEIMTLFGETSWRLERTPCRGKYCGHTDFTLVFGSGRRLYIGLDERNYRNNLWDHLRVIRRFRERQAENTQKIRRELAEHNTPFSDVEVEILPYNGTSDLTLFAVVILHTKVGAQFVYRTTNMHGFLVGYEGACFSFDHCMAHLLEDSCGKMAYTHLLSKDSAVGLSKPDHNGAA